MMNTTMDRLHQDLVIALRRLRSTPGFTLAAILTLALGVGANTTIFSGVNALLFRPMQVDRQEELVTLDFVGNNEGIPLQSYPNYRDLRDRNDVLAGLVAYRPYLIGFSRTGETSSRVLVFEVSGNYFDVLGVKAARGRLIGAADDVTKNGHPVVVVSHSFWQQRLGSDPNAVGSTAKLNGLTYTIIGVAPAGFFGTELMLNPDVFVPIAMQARMEPGDDWMEERRSRNIFVLGRLKSGIAMARAEAGLDSVLAQLAREFPEANEGWHISLSRPGLFGALVRGPMVGFSAVLMSVAGMVLLAACVNIASQLLARAADRRKETAVRMALGAGRTDLIRQLLTESSILSIVGGVVGLLITVWLAQLYAAWRASTQLPIQDLRIDGNVMLFAAIASVVTGILSGIGPALRSTRSGVAASLKEESIIESLKGWHLRDALVIAQVGLSAVLLVGSVLVVRSLQNALNVKLGFEPRHAVVASFDMGFQGYDRATAKQFDERLIERVRSLPGIESAGLINGLPLTLAISNCYIYVEGKPALRDADTRMAARYWTSPGYLRAAQTRLIAGRDFDTSDETDRSRSVLVNQTFAQELFPGENPLGKRFRYCDRNSDPREIVGVVEDGKYRSLGESPLIAVFSPLAQYPGLQRNIIARSSLPESDVVGMVRRAVQELDPSMALFDAGSVTDILAYALLPARVTATALAAFGLLAVVLTATGVYGVMAYAVSRRVREIGIRMALGASPANVLRLVLGRAIMLITVGTVGGLLLALAAGRLFNPILYQVSATDPLTYILSIALLVTIAAIACIVPARRAIRVDPVNAIRAE